MSYITLSGLGQSGGLCSQLQTYASLCAVAKANKKQIVFSEDMIVGKEVDYYNGEKYQTRIRVFDLLDIDYTVVPKEFFNDFVRKPINFHTTTYDETLFNLDPDKNYNLDGRFDLYTYWYNDIGREVAAWKLKPYLEQQAEERYSEIKATLGDKPTVSIHLRRGDYLLPMHHFADLSDGEYYEKAIVQQFLPTDDYNFIVFSNDIEYAKQLFSGDNIWFVDPKGGEKVCSDSEKEDFALMTRCDHHIIANSSYSWWAAYLCKNENKRVVCPTNHLKKTHSASWINGRYFPPNWINIDNKA